MTQLDLPPISLARYFELLKRRRWQVLPMSLVGLVVGGLIAWFIPRYYVALTSVVYTGPVLDTDAQSENDPIYVMVRGAQNSILAVIPDALEELKVIGENAADPARQPLIDAFTQRTTVNGMPFEKGSSRYLVTIEYRDTDGERSAAFANTLRKIWTDQLVGEFVEHASNDMRDAQDAVRAHRVAVDDKLNEIRAFRDEHGIEPTEDSATVQSSLSGRLLEARREVDTVKAKLASAEAEVAELLRDLGVTIPQKIRKESSLAGKELTVEQQQAIAAVVYSKMAMDGCVEGTELRRFWDRQFQAAMVQANVAVPGGILGVLTGGAGGVSVVEEDNPEYAEAKKRLETRQREIKSLTAELEVRQASVREIERRLAEAGTVWIDYERMTSQLAALQRSYEDALANAARLERVFDRARNRDAFTRVIVAQVPLAPTEPNITLVALAGSVLGLGVAIGLILLLDVLRSTFKTVEDVGYALKVPVLGAMSYLETEEVRAETVRSRRIVTLVTVVFVVLLLSVLTIYYVAPTRLPPFVLQALDAVLGGDTAG